MTLAPAEIRRGLRAGAFGTLQVAVCAALLLAAASLAPPPEAGPIGRLPQTLPAPAFTLTESSGRALGLADLRGRPWIADFVFTRCAGPCPAITQEMMRLQADLPAVVRLVTFSVDPENDTPAVLAEYAARAGAQTDRWYFLTGSKETLRPVVTEGFHLVARDDPERIVLHDRRLVLVDGDARILGYYSQEDPQAMADLRSDARRLVAAAAGPAGPVPLAVFPPLNAGLNGLCAAFLVLGWVLVKRQRYVAHIAAMCAAFGTSILFLGCYLYYHAHHGATSFTGSGWVRPVYFGILLSHTLLAAAVPFLALCTLVRGARGQFDRHVRLARWTLPLWLYVSVTGVVVYVMLYHLYPAAAAVAGQG